MHNIMKPCKLSTWRRAVHLFFISSFTLFGVSRSCGIITHIEISHRAFENYEDIHGDVDFGQIASSYQDALEAGSAFPDVFYPPTCFFGDFNDVSEDTHWTPFVKASVNYINKKYPKPWKERTKKLVAFLLGVVSHQVADVLWHSLGIDQGFLQTMAKINFHDVYTDAHPIGDLGGDILNVYQLNLDYSFLLGDWYVPTHDLAGIYEELYGNSRVNPFVITVCSKMAFLYKFAARLGAGLFYPEYAKQSPFLVDNLYSYFQGGINDMASWSRRIWKEFSLGLENGPGICDWNHSALFIRCNSSYQIHGDRDDSTNLKNGFYSKMDLGDLSPDDIVVVEAEGGIFLRPGQKLKERLTFQSRSKSLHFQSELDEQLKSAEVEQHSMDYSTLPNKIFTTRKAYAQFGSALAVGDLNGDGYDDLAVGSAGVYPGGVVYVIFGSSGGIGTLYDDIEQAAHVTIPMPVDKHSSDSLFGSALAIFDFDRDGTLDLAVGAPSYKSEDLLYQGRVFVFSINGHSATNVSLRATVDCPERFCNLGYTLSAGDNETMGGLIIGAPFTGGSDGEQKGRISFLAASVQYAGLEDMYFIAGVSGSHTEFESTEESGISSIEGSLNYSWAGYSFGTAAYNNQPYLMFGEPGLRTCSNASCEYQPDDRQMAGSVRGGTLTGGSYTQLHRISTSDQFALLGKQVSSGKPTVGQKFIAVSAPDIGVKGKILTRNYTLQQAGLVVTIADFTINAFIQGDRNYDRFGDMIKFADLNNDGVDELIVGAPLWTSWLPFGGVQKGKVYVYGGGKFPLGAVSGNCGDSFITPCPGKRAYKVLTFGENLARFGTSAAAIKSSSKTSLFVTAAHSSKGGRLAGAIAMFDFSH